MGIKKLIGKVALYGTILTFAGVVGDKYNIDNKLFGRFYEQIWPAESGYIQNYTSIEIKYERVNNKTRVFLYNTKTKEKKRINPDLITGSLDDVIRHVIVYGTKQGFYETKEKFNDLRRELPSKSKSFARKIWLFSDYLRLKIKENFEKWRSKQQKKEEGLKKE